MLLQAGASSQGGGLFSEASVWGLTLAGALETVAGGSMAVLLGLGAALRPKPLSGCCPLTFLHSSVLPDVRVCVQLRGLN